MPNVLHHFFDESGDTGFKFLTGSSLHWAGALVSTDDPWALRTRIEVLKAELGVASHFEFRFHDANEETKRRFFAAMRGCSFSVRAVVVDKQALSESFRRMSKPEFYGHFITELVLRAPDEAIHNDILVIDDSTKRLVKVLRVHLSRMTRERGMSRKFKKIVAKDSRRDGAIQCADMVVGAIVGMWKGGEWSYYGTFEDRVRDLWVYREEEVGET